MLSYTIDNTDTQMFLDRFGIQEAAATALFFKQAVPILQKIIIDTITQLASSEPGFPKEYTTHLLSVVYANPPILLGPTGVEVDFELLGTYEDYTTGFHRHAIGSDNQRIELPYLGQELKSTTQVREAYWENEVVGSSQYQDTIQDRITAWGSKAPEWWLLQNGSDSNPYVKPTVLAEEVAARATIELTALYEQTLQDAIILSDSGLGVSSVGTIYYNIRNELGQFAPRG
jgi:hypothetical protein